MTCPNSLSSYLPPIFPGTRHEQDGMGLRACRKPRHTIRHATGTNSTPSIVPPALSGTRFSRHAETGMEWGLCRVPDVPAKNRGPAGRKLGGHHDHT